MNLVHIFIFKKNTISTTFLQHFHNKSYVIDCYRLLLVEQKRNFINKFKFEPLITNYLWFIVKILEKCCGRSNSLIFNISVVLITKEMLCSHYFHNTFTINFKWQVITSCYWSDKKVILVVGSNLNTALSQ